MDAEITPEGGENNPSSAGKSVGAPIAARRIFGENNPSSAGKSVEGVNGDNCSVIRLRCKAQPFVR